MTNGDWNNAHRAWLGMLLTAPGAEALLLLLHAGGQDIPFRLPGPAGQTWRTLLDTADRDFTGPAAPHPATGSVLLRHRSLLLLQAGTVDD